MPGAAKLEVVAASGRQRLTLHRAKAGGRHFVPGAAKLEVVAGIGASAPNIAPGRSR